MALDLGYIEEPLLQFGRDRHPDIRYGIMNFGPFDLLEKRRPATIKIGVVGTPAAIGGFNRWLDRCRSEIAGKESPKRNLFAPFPGFSSESPFEALCVLDPSLNCEIQPDEIAQLEKLQDFNSRVAASVKLFLCGLQNSAQKKPDVLVCLMPLELLSLLGEADEEVDDDSPALDFRAEKARLRAKFNFHDMLKAKALPLGIPIQLVRPSTFDRKLRSKEKDSFAHVRSMQDEATCAWNFFIAVYYKAGGFPWRLIRQMSDWTACFIGISFYEALDRSKLLTSIAQVFDERGHGLVVQGARVKLDKEDRQPRLDSKGTHLLLKSALKNYRQEHGTYPARVVIHKSSTFSELELAGTKKALEEAGISRFDLLSMSGRWTRLARKGYYPPLRGTFWQMDDKKTLLYTNGSVQLYEEYPGLYVPKTLLVVHDHFQADRQQLASEILTLTKMNWNNSQITALEPITLRAARQVGRIMKYADARDTALNYRFFM